MDKAEASGKTVDDALNRALAELGASRDEVEFTVLDEGKRGGLFGRSRDARVSVTRVAPAGRPAGEAPPRPASSSRRPASGPGEGGGQGRREGDRRPEGGRQQGQRGPDRGQGRGGRGGGGARAGVEPVQPRITDADFLMPRAGGEPAQPSGSAAAGGRGRDGDSRPPRGRGRRGDGPRDGGPRESGPREDGPPRGERRPQGERSRAPQEEVKPDIHAPEVDFAAQTVDDLLRILAIEAEIAIREPQTPGDGLGTVLAVIDISGEDLGLLIGRRGDTLIALQYLVNLIVARKFPGHGGVTVDVEHYRHRNEERITSLARRMADRVRETGNPITLEPMSAAERRLIHMQFAEDPELETQSIGEGENRKVVISAKR